jgi:hypothetical protein
VGRALAPHRRTLVKSINKSEQIPRISAQANQSSLLNVTFPYPCRRAATKTPRGNGLRPQCTAGFTARMRGATGARGARTTATPPGRITAASIPSIQHSGPKIRPACGTSRNSATISGSASKCAN